MPQTYVPKQPEQIVVDSEPEYNQSEFDEGTVRSNVPQRSRRIYDQEPAISPRMQVTRAVYQPPQQFNEDPVSKVEQAYDAQQKRFARPEMSRDQWLEIQQRIDSEYERKLKAVGDDAMYKLKAF